MSWQAVKSVLTHSSTKNATRLVLVCIAEHADANGRGSSPGVPLLAQEANLSERQVIRVIQQLEADYGKEIRVHRGHGRGNLHTFDILLPMPEKVTFDVATGTEKVTNEPFHSGKGDICATEKVTNGARKGDICAVKGDISEIKGDICDTDSIRTRAEPLRSHIEPKEKPLGVGSDGKTASPTTTKQKKTNQTNDEWIAELKASPAYSHIGIDAEADKMRLWCETNGKQPTRRRFLNWLNRIEKPLPGAARASPRPMSRHEQNMTEGKADTEKFLQDRAQGRPYTDRIAAKVAAGTLPTRRR